MSQICKNPSVRFEVRIVFLHTGILITHALKNNQQFSGPTLL